MCGDSHNPDQLATNYERLPAFLAELGVETLHYLEAPIGEAATVHASTEWKAWFSKLSATRQD